MGLVVAEQREQCGLRDCIGKSLSIFWWSWPALHAIAQPEVRRQAAKRRLVRPRADDAKPRTGPLTQDRGQCRDQAVVTFVPLQATDRDDQIWIDGPRL